MGAIPRFTNKNLKNPVFMRGCEVLIFLDRCNIEVNVADEKRRRLQKLPPVGHNRCFLSGRWARVYPDKDGFLSGIWTERGQHRLTKLFLCFTL